MFLDFLTQTWKNTACTVIKRPPESFPRSFVLVCCLRVNVCSPPHQLIRTGMTGDGAGAGPSVTHPWSASNRGHCPPPEEAPVCPFLLRGAWQTCCRLLVLVEGSASLMVHGGGRRFGPIQAFTPICSIQERLVLPDGEFRRRPETLEIENEWKI